MTGSIKSKKGCDMLMRLKTIFCVLAIVIATALFNVVYAAVPTISNIDEQIKYDLNEIHISLEINNPILNGGINIFVFKENFVPVSASDFRMEKVLAIGQYKISNIEIGSSNVTFNAVLKFDSQEIKTGWHRIIISGTSFEEFYSKQIYIVNQKEMYDALKDLSVKTGNDIDAIFNEFSEAFKISLGGLYSEHKQEFLNIFAEERKNHEFNSPEEVMPVFGLTSAVVGFNYTIDKPKYIFDNYNILNINNSDIKGDYKNKKYVKDSVDMLIGQYFSIDFPNTKIISSQDLNNKLKVFIALSVVNLSNREEMDIELNDYKQVLELANFDDVYNKYDKIEISKALTRKNFKTLEEIRVAFSEKIRELKELQESNEKGNFTGQNRASENRVMNFSPSFNYQKELEPNSTSTIIFSDVSENMWARHPIEYLYKMKIISGREDGRFYPNNPISREEFVKLIVLAFDIPISVGDSKFIDVSNQSWYEQYVNAAYNAGIVTGINTNEFGIGQPLTRQQMAVIIDRALSKAKKDISIDREVIEITDIDMIDMYARDSVKNLYGKGIVKGMGEGRFEPKSEVTRAQASQIIYNILEN